jgi:hypothetical protein
VLAEVGSLHRVEHVAAGAVGLGAARRIRDRQEDAAAVPLEPVERERLRLAPELESRGGEVTEERRLVAAAADRDALASGGLDLGENTQLGIVVEGWVGGAPLPGVLERGGFFSSRLRPPVRPTI